MKKHILHSLAFTLASLMAVTGCQGVVCEDGTVDDDGRCVASLTPSCGPGTELDGRGRCEPKADEGVPCGKEGSNTFEDPNTGACVSVVDGLGNAGVYATMVLSKPVNIAGPANEFIATDLSRSGGSVTFLGAYQFGTNLRLWGGVIADENNDERRYVLKDSNAFDIPATLAGNQFTSEKVTIPLQILGQETALEEVVFSAGELDATGTITVPSKVHIVGILTPANAKRVLVSQVDNKPLDVVLMTLEDLPNADGNWIVEADVTLNPAWVYQR